MNRNFTGRRIFVKGLQVEEITLSKLWELWEVETVQNNKFNIAMPFIICGK